MKLAGSVPSRAAASPRHWSGSFTPRFRVVEVQPLAAAFRNPNFKLRLEAVPEWIVLRIYEHDASLCQKEVDLIRVVGGERFLW